MEAPMRAEAVDNLKNLQHSRFIITMNVVNTVTHFLLGAVAFTALYFANSLFFSSSYKSHIFLCVIGYVILIAQGVLAVSPYNGWSNLLTYNDKKICHWILQVLGSILAITGSLLRLIDTSSTHFVSAHGILGIIAMVLTFLSLIGGIINMLSVRLNVNVTFMRVCHAVIGCLVMITSFSSLCCAFHSYYRFITTDGNAALAISMTVLALIGIILTASLRCLSRICNS